MITTNRTNLTRTDSIDSMFKNYFSVEILLKKKLKERVKEAWTSYDLVKR